jgi:hypothetical protein
MLSITRFRERLSDPEILLDPLLEFIDRYPARQVADTLSPLFIRSADVRPQLAKIVVLELPAEVIGALLEHVVDQLASTQPGRDTLKKLMLSVWKTLPSSEVKKAVLAINERDPAALFDIVIPIVRTLSAPALAAVTVEFLRYEEIFYRYNGAAMRDLPPQSIVQIAEAATKSPDDFYRLANEVVHKIPPAEQNALLLRFVAVPGIFFILDQMVAATPRNFRVEVTKRFVANPAQAREIARGLPKRLTEQFADSFRGP